MRRIFQFGLGMAAALAIPAGAQAQRVRSAPVAVAAPARLRIMGTTQAQTTRLTASGRLGSTFFNGFAFSSFRTLLLQPFFVPGLGFDFTHLAAINRNLDARALVDPVTQHRLALAQQFVGVAPFLPFAFPFGSGAPQVIIVQQPPVVILQQPPAPEESAERVRYVEREAKPELARPPETPRELGELVLVRRDGTLVFVVAFSKQRDRIIYVTREGIRRSLPLAELDIEATLQMNEERGTTLHLPV
jgi:hypothetical protein